MERIFHIAREDDWVAAQSERLYRVSTLGRTLEEEGFIHCALRHQVERIANAFYRDVPRLVLLVIEPERIDSEIRYENLEGGSELFPHIYGPLPIEAIVATPALAPRRVGMFIPESSWLNPGLEIRPSRIEGLGLFATRPIQEREVCAVLGGEVLTDDELHAHVADRDRWSAAAVDDGLNVLQADDDPVARANHSCDPNLWLADAITVVSRRHIGAGEEATIDYALMTVDEGWQMECRCRSQRCRRVVTGSDWTRGDLQKRYRAHFAPFINKRLESSD